MHETRLSLFPQTRAGQPATTATDVWAAGKMFEEMCVAYETRHAEAAAQLGPLRRVLKRMQKPQPAERPDALAVVTNVRAACISPCTLKLQASANKLHTPSQLCCSFCPACCSWRCQYLLFALAAWAFNCAGGPDASGPHPGRCQGAQASHVRRPPAAGVAEPGRPPGEPSFLLVYFSAPAVYAHIYQTRASRAPLRPRRSWRPSLCAWTGAT